MENMSRKINVVINDKISESFNLIQDADLPQTFIFKETASVSKVKISIESTFGGKNSGGNFSIMGVRCADPDAAAKAVKEQESAALGTKEVIKPVIKSCSDSIEMESDKMLISCLESCPIVDADFKQVNGKFTMSSKVCVAAQVFFKDKPEAKHKDFGIIRVKNEDKVGDETPPFLFTFDSSLVKVEKKFKANEEVDVLDPAQCWIRAKVVGVEGESVKINFNQETKS